jgi:hypothetical protein
MEKQSDFVQEISMTLVMSTFKEANGFSSLSADELFFVNGGSGFSMGMSGASAGGGNVCTTNSIGPGNPNLGQETMALAQVAKGLLTHNLSDVLMGTGNLLSIPPASKQSQFTTGSSGSSGK